MKKWYLFFIISALIFNKLSADFSIFARGHKIGSYKIFNEKNRYYTISNLSFNILGYNKSITDSCYSILNADYSLKYLDYIHYENGKRREIFAKREKSKLIFGGDFNETLYVANKRVFTDIGIEKILPELKLPDSINLISSGMWRIKKVYCFKKTDTIVVKSDKALFKYVYKDGKFMSMTGPGELFIGNRKGAVFKKDILNSYRIKAEGVKIRQRKRYEKIVFKAPKDYKFPEIKGFQHYEKGEFIVNPTVCKDIKSRKTFLKTTEYYDFNNPVFVNVIEKLKNRTPLAIARYVRDIMRPAPNMYPEKGSEIFKKRKGDCSEYATLLTTILRGEGYPAYNVYGLVYMNGYYYYHAWVRFYDKGWKYLDPTAGAYCDAKYIVLQEDREGGFSKDINFMSDRSLKIIDVR